VTGLDDKIPRQFIAKTSAESLSEADLIQRDSQSPLSPNQFNGGDCKVTRYIEHVVGKFKHLHCLKYKLADERAGKLTTPETWARDNGSRVTGQLADTPTRGLDISRTGQLAD